MKGRVLDENILLSAEKVFRARCVLNDLDQVCGASRTGLKDRPIKDWSLRDP